MDIYEWIPIGIVLASYGLPLAIGLCVANPWTAIALAAGSFCGLYAFVWSTLGPLFLPWAATLIDRYELSALLIVSFIGGALRAAVLAAIGYGRRRLLMKLLKRRGGATPAR
jgi:hypothetical protein